MTQEVMSPAVNGIRSKDRVRELAEVYTPSWIVENMLDLVGEETHFVDTTFLEPSCGNGNFLVAILERKAFGIEKEMSEAPHGVDATIRLLQAIATISAIDISPGNIDEAHVRMLRHAVGWHRYLTGSEPSQAWAITCYEIIRHKIVVGDFLMKTAILHDVTVFDEGLVTMKPWKITGDPYDYKAKNRKPAQKGIAGAPR